MHSFASVAAVARPIIENIATHVDQLVLLRTGARSEAGHTAFMVCQQVVVERHAPSAHDSAVAMATFLVAGCAEAFADEAPLHSGIGVAVDGARFINRPADGAVVDDDISMVGPA